MASISSPEGGASIMRLNNGAWGKKRRIAAAAAQHPESILRALYHGQLRAGAWRLPYVGEVEGQKYATAAQRWRCSASRCT